MAFARLVAAVTTASLCLLSISSCSVPRPFATEEVAEDGPQTTARIAFSYPQVFSRESLINDRIKEGDFLGQLLSDSAGAQFEPQLRRDLTTITSIAAQLGITFNPAAGGDFQRSKQLDDIKQEIELTKLRAELQRVQQAYQNLQAGTGTGPTAPSSTTPGQVTSQNIDQSVAKEQLNSVMERTKAALEKLEKFASAGPRQAGVTQSPEDRFRDLQAYRAELRSALNTAKLDDVHDRDGHALFRMQFSATVFPGAGDAKRQFGIARIEIKPPKLSEIEIERLYLRWLAHSTARLNRVDRLGRLRSDPQYASLVNESAVMGLVGLSDGVVSLTDAQTMLIAVNPDHIHEIKWLIFGRRYETLGAVNKLLKQYLIEYPGSLNASQPTDGFNKALHDAMKTDSGCTFFRDAAFQNPNLYPAPPEPESKQPTRPAQGRAATAKAAAEKAKEAADRAKAAAEHAKNMAWALQEIFERIDTIALVNPFLQAGLQSGLNIESERDQARARLPHEKTIGPKRESGVALLDGAANTSGDMLWLVKKIYKKIEACGERSKLLEQRERKVEVPCEFSTAVANQGAAFVTACGKPARYEGTKLARLRALTVEAAPAAAAGKIDPFIEASGMSVVYAVTPSERAQRVSTVASAANSAQVALGLAAGLPSSGVGAQAGIGHLQSAIGNADALDRLPLVVGFSDHRVDTLTKRSRFGWVFGPQSYIYVPVIGRSRIALRHVVSTHQVAVDISVPVWWPRLTLEVTTAWVGSAWNNPDDYLGTDWNGRAQEMEVNLPRTFGDLDSLTAYLLSRSPPFGIRPVRIDRVEPEQVLCNSEITMLIYGLNLWRNPRVYLAGVMGKNVSVLPDMQGIAVDFTIGNSQKAAVTRQPLVVWTQSGHAEYVVDIEKANCADKTTGSKVSFAAKRFVNNTTLELIAAKDTVPSSFFDLRLGLKPADTRTSWQWTKSEKTPEYDADKQLLGATINVKSPPAGYLKDGDSAVVAVLIQTKPGTAIIELVAPEPSIFFTTEDAAKVKIKPPSAKGLPATITLTLPANAETAFPDLKGANLIAKVKDQPAIALRVEQFKRDGKSMQAKISARDPAKLDPLKGEYEVQFEFEKGGARDFPAFSGSLKISQKPAAEPRKPDPVSPAQANENSKPSPAPQTNVKKTDAQKTTKGR